MEYAYLFDGSWEGLLTAVFEAFESKRWPQAVLEEKNAQLAFGEEAVRIRTDPDKARRVVDGIRKRMGSPACRKIWTAYLSYSPDKPGIIYRYICTGMQKGRGIYAALAHHDVAALEHMIYHVGHEAHLLQGFVRFSRMENGVYYARITPKNSVLPIIMPFFADRYSDQPLLIFDQAHALAGVYDLKEWYLVETSHINLPEYAPEEALYRRLWKQFYKSIAIADRTNHKLRRSLMPKRFWGNMTEFEPGV